MTEPGYNAAGNPIEVVPVVVISQVFTARPSSIPDIRDFVRRCLAESPLNDEGTREVGETVFRALLQAAGPTGSIQVAFRIFPEHVEVDVLHSDTVIQPPTVPGPPVSTVIPAQAGSPENVHSHLGHAAHVSQLLRPPQSGPGWNGLRPVPAGPLPAFRLGGDGHGADPGRADPGRADPGRADPGRAGANGQGAGANGQGAGANGQPRPVANDQAGAGANGEARPVANGRAAGEEANGAARAAWAQAVLGGFAGDGGHAAGPDGPSPAGTGGAADGRPAAGADHGLPAASAGDGHAAGLSCAGLPGSEPGRDASAGDGHDGRLAGLPQPETFAEWMASALRRQGLTQEAAARQLGVSVKTVSRWVGGATEPRMRDLRRIQELFGEVPIP